MKWRSYPHPRPRPRFLPRQPIYLLFITVFVITIAFKLVSAPRDAAGPSGSAIFRFVSTVDKDAAAAFSNTAVVEPCCAPRAGTRCVMSADPPLALRRGRQLRIGFVTYATGPYGAFVEDLWASLRARAFVGHEVHLFFFTDRANDPFFLDDPRVHKRQQRRLGWPFDSLGRHFLYLAAADWFEGMDYLISVDADSILQGTLTESVLGDRIATIQAWQYGHPKRDWTLERRRTVMGVPFSSGFVTDAEATCYFTGNLFGGSREGFMQLLREIVDFARADLSAFPRRVALWHDESYLNAALFARAPSVIWGPNFMYPEPPSDEWLYSDENVAHGVWRGPRGSSSSATDPAIRFPPNARVFLNLGVRKHSAHTLAEFQPLTSELPAEMSETGAARRFPLPPPKAQVASMFTFLVRVASVPAADSPLAAAMGQWCAEVCCRLLLPSGVMATAAFLPECGASGAAATRVSRAADAEQRRGSNAPRTKEVSVALALAKDALARESGAAAEFAVVLTTEAALTLRDSPLTKPETENALANMVFVLESTHGDAATRVGGRERSSIDAVWGCIAMPMAEDAVGGAAARAILVREAACGAGSVIFDTREAACWGDEVGVSAPALPLMARVEFATSQLATESTFLKGNIARCLFMRDGW